MRRVVIRTELVIYDDDGNPVKPSVLALSRTFTEADLEALRHLPSVREVISQEAGGQFLLALTHAAQDHHAD